MTGTEPLNAQKKLIESLAAALEKDGAPVRLFETHISWVLVAGAFAYKFKKALRLDFVDYSALEDRRFYCEEELRLNRRLAPHIYLSVVPVAGSPESPALGGQGAAIDYAVKMHAFEQSALWVHRIGNRLILPSEIDALAAVLARFHRDAAVAPKDSAWCTPDALQAVTAANLDEIARLAGAAEERRRVDALRAWDDAQRRRLRAAFARRKETGFIRECHGDLHGGNILTIDGRVEVFDCIEFNPSLRWIDVMNDIAFACMDLAFQHRPDFAARLLNRYLELTGDYEGLAVLRYYEIHRALVRAKVALLHARQLPAAAPETQRQERLGNSYLAFAIRGSEPPRPALMITHGLSGSGKTTFSRAAAELTGAIHLRSDVERKRIHGLSATARAAAFPDAGLYAAAATRSTYRHLREAAKHALEAGWPVIVDAAFLKAEQRAWFASLAAESNVALFIFDIQADEAVMRARIASRQALDNDASDAGLAVLAHQLAHREPLAAGETGTLIAVDMNPGLEQDALRKACAPVLRMLQAPSGKDRIEW